MSDTARPVDILKVAQGKRFKAARRCLECGIKSKVEQDLRVYNPTQTYCGSGMCRNTRTLHVALHPTEDFVVTLRYLNDLTPDLITSQGTLGTSREEALIRARRVVTYLKEEELDWPWGNEWAEEKS